MLRFSEKDKELVDLGYQNFLHSLCEYLKDCVATCLMDYYKQIRVMLKKGAFSYEGTFLRNPKFPYIALSNMESDGVHIMYGIACCRHISAFLQDILRLLGFDATLLYVFADDSGTWRRVSPSDANHLLVLVHDGATSYIFDLMNDFAFLWEPDTSLILLPVNDVSFSADYHDENVQDIGRILKKYYTLRSYGIETVYD